MPPVLHLSPPHWTQIEGHASLFLGFEITKNRMARDLGSREHEEYLIFSSSLRIQSCNGTYPAERYRDARSTTS